MFDDDSLKFNQHPDFFYLQKMKTIQNHKDEIFLLEEFINKHKSDNNSSIYDHPIYLEIFKYILNSKLTICEDK